MTIMLERPAAGAFIISEDSPRLGRKVALVASGEQLYPGRIVGRILATSATTKFTGTGNGALTMDATTPLLAGVQEGRYTATCGEPGSDAGQFTIRDPGGVVLGSCTAGGAAFANQIKFAIADGATDFVAGDQFEIFVKAGTASAVTGTGNGTLTLYQTLEGVQIGTYTLACTAAAANGGAFSVTAPDGTVIGNATVGTRFQAGGLDFLIADGSSDFIVGDSFTITVTRGQVKEYNPANTDGSGRPWGIMHARADAWARGVVVLGPGVVNADKLTWFSGATAAQKIAGLAQLADTQRLIAR